MPIAPAGSSSTLRSPALTLVTGGTPGTAFQSRLQAACAAVLAGTADLEQQINLRCTVTGAVRAAAQDLLVRVAVEMVENAVEIGMHMRLLGSIAVTVSERRGGIGLEVADDGWARGLAACPNDWRCPSCIEAVRRGGAFSLERREDRTIARLTLGTAIG